MPGLDAAPGVTRLAAACAALQTAEASGDAEAAARLGASVPVAEAAAAGARAPGVRFPISFRRAPPSRSSAARALFNSAADA
jgi:hypothetical protein